MIRKDYTGHIFGDFVVVKYSKSTKYHQAIYEVKCTVCGHTKQITIPMLKKDNICKFCEKNAKKMLVVTKKIDTRPRHKNGRIISKHSDETIGDFILCDTGDRVGNSRNRLYKATCVHCGEVKYGQYSDIYRRCFCKCQKN